MKIGGVLPLILWYDFIVLSPLLRGFFFFEEFRYFDYFYYRGVLGPKFVHYCGVFRYFNVLYCGVLLYLNWLWKQLHCVMFSTMASRGWFPHLIFLPKWHNLGRNIFEVAYSYENFSFFSDFHPSLIWKVNEMR